MKKYLVYWSIFIVLFAVLFAWWWTRPAHYIERVTTVKIASEGTLFSESKDSTNVYLLKVASSDVKKIIDGCEFHGGTFASVGQTSAARFGNDPVFNAQGFFKSNHIGCFIKENKEKGDWEFYVKDDLLYFQIKD